MSTTNDIINNEYFEVKRDLKNQVQADELSGVPVLDRARVVELAQRIYPDVIDWAAQYPILQLRPLQKRYAATCLANAAMCPDAPLAAVIASTEFSLLMWAIDDLADNIIGTWTADQIVAMLDLYNHIVASRGTTNYQDYVSTLENVFELIADNQPWLQLATAFCHFCLKLNQFPAAANFYWFFQKRFDLMIKSFKIEDKWKTDYKLNGLYPPLETYLENGKESVIAPVVEGALLAMVGTEGTEATEDSVANQFQLPYSTSEALLDAVTLTSGCVIRLTNDVRSFERERVEKKINSLLVLMLSKNLTEKEAEAVILTRAAETLKELDTLVGQLPENLQKWGDYTKRLAYFTKDWYMVREFHDFTYQKLTELAKQSI